MPLSSRLKRALLPTFCMKPGPTLDDEPAPSRRHRMPASPQDLQPRGPQPDGSLRRRSFGWLRLRHSHHARQDAPPSTVPRQDPGTASASRPSAKLELQRPPSGPNLAVASLQDRGPLFDTSRSSSLRVEVSQSDLEAVLAGASTRAAQWLRQPRTEPLDAWASFDRRSHDSRDPTVHGPLDPSMWHDLTLRQWAITGPGARPPAAEAPAETQRSLGAEVLRIGGVLAGHTARQVVATGTSTLLREAVNIGITMGLRNHHGLAAGLTVAMTLLNLLAQLQREKRVLRAPDEAARGFHSLSEAQWQAASSEQRETLRQEQQASSRRITRLHLVSNLLTSAVALAGAARPGGRIGAMPAPLPSALLGQMARQWVYVGVRDGLQSTFSLVQPRKASPLPNIEQQRMRTAAATYGGAQAMLGYVQEAVMPRVLGALSRGSDTIRAGGGLLSSVGSGLGQWARAIAGVAGVRAAVNTVGETIDDLQLTHHDAAQAGSEQVLRPDVRALDPARRDHGRLLDHAMVRVFANDVVGGVMNAVGLAAGQLPARFGDVASFIGNFGVGYLIHLTYPMVGNNFAAAGLAREAMRPPPPMDLEASVHAPLTPSAASQASRASSYYRPEA
jgi:hypothetical protein